MRKISRVLFDIYNKEIHEIETKTLPSLREQITEARNLGDYRENEELATARNEMTFAKNRLVVLNSLVSDCKVVEYSNMNEFEIGSFFNLKFLDNKTGQVIRDLGLWLYDSSEEPDVHIISEDSALGKKIAENEKSLLFNEDTILEFKNAMNETLTALITPRRPKDLADDTHSYVEVFEEFYRENIKMFNENDWRSMIYLGKKEEIIEYQYRNFKDEENLINLYKNFLNSVSNDTMELHYSIIYRLNKEDSDNEENYFLTIFGDIHE